MIPIAQGRQGDIYAIYLEDQAVGEDKRGHVSLDDGSYHPSSNDRNARNPSYSHLTNHDRKDGYDITYTGRNTSMRAIKIDQHGGLNNWRAIKLVYGPPNGKVRGREPHNIVREVGLLRRINHPNIIKLLNYEYKPDLLRHELSFPLFPISLSSLFQDPSFPFHFDGPLTSNLRSILIPKKITFQLVSAISYLHNLKAPISHRDLNPSNILFDLNGELKLIDFGIAFSPSSSRASELSYRKDQDAPPNDNTLSGDSDLNDVKGEENERMMYCDVGTGSYRAPELLFSPTSYDPMKIDLWAMGCIISQLFRPYTSSQMASSPSSSSSSSSLSSSSDSSLNGGDEIHDPLDESDFPESSQVAKKERKPLFDSTYGSLGLASSIFKILGKPTIENWPEFNQLPDSNKIEFPAYPINPLEYRLPELPNHYSEVEKQDILDVINGLLKLDPKSRIDARNVIGMNWFKGTNNNPKSIPKIEERDDVWPRWMNDSLIRYQDFEKR